MQHSQHGERALCSSSSTNPHPTHFPFSVSGLYQSPAQSADQVLRTWWLSTWDDRTLKTSPRLGKAYDCYPQISGLMAGGVVSTFPPSLERYVSISWRSFRHTNHSLAIRCGRQEGQRVDHRIP